MDTMILNAELLRIAYRFIAKADVRRYLGGVKVEPCAKGGALLIATNGHILAVVHDRDAKNVRECLLNIAPDTAKKMQKAYFVHIKERLEIVKESSKVSFIQTSEPYLDGRFPDWRSVIPKPEKVKPGLIANCQGIYLHEACKAIADLRGVARFFSTAKEGPVIIRPSSFHNANNYDDDTIFIMVMPTIINPTGPIVPIPDWLNMPVQK